MTETHDHTAHPRCDDPAGCDCGPADTRGPSRRRFLGVMSGALLATALPAGAIAVPADKNLDPRWLDRIRGRGDVTTVRGAALANVGMPVGGIGTGQVYAAGDGRLWLWDVLNDDTAFYGGADFLGIHYADPLEITSLFGTGFVLRTRSAGGRTTTVPLDADGFPDTTFAGRYPIGSVALRGADAPAEVDLDVYTPFVPTVVADSELPVTVCEYTVRNPTTATVHYDLLGHSDNPVCLRSRTRQPITLTSREIGLGATAAGVGFAAKATPIDDPVRDDILFEDWSGTGYAGWTVTGDAFGPGPVDEADLPPEMLRAGSLGTATGRFVTSYAFRAGANPDDHTGSLRSKDFTITRDGVLTRVGGGHDDGLAIRVVVDGATVASATGLRAESVRPVHLDVSQYRGRTGHLEIVDERTGAWGHVNCDRIVFSDRAAPRPDVVFETWDDGFAGWTEKGTAFGDGPVTEAEAPAYFVREGPLNLLDERFVTSHDFRAHSPADGGVAADAETGSLTSEAFTVERRYLVASIGGGGDTSQVGLRVVVDGTTVARLAGVNSETLAVQAFDLSGWTGRSAHLELVDDATGGWGHTNVGRIWFSDLPIRVERYGDLRDAGTFGLAAYTRDVSVRPSVRRPDDAQAWFDTPDAKPGSTQSATVTASFQLLPGEQRTVRFAYAWNFPRVSAAKFGFLDNGPQLRHHYANRYRDATAVLSRIARRGDELSELTHRFVDTWYGDTTLPHWFVERTFAPASTVGTETCQYFDNGRFYAWEGAYCCAGTCTHVWNYAQSVAYLFPELERAARTHNDYDIGFHADTGAIDYRGEADRRVAHDGQCGNILRTYREHQQATTYDFLRSVWPQVKKATQYLIGHDGTNPNGIFETDQYNTLDATWYGEIPWISGLYVAALQAAAEMALDTGDDDFARQCRTIAASGTDYLDEVLWNEKYQYYEQHLDPQHLDATNSNRGCYIDQMFGQAYAHLLALDPVFDATKADTALRSVYRNNFMPSAAAYQKTSGIDGGRVYTVGDEAGTLMCTWPFGGTDEAPGSGVPSSVAYFNEVWTGTEWQFASHLLRAGHVDEGLAVARAIYDRYAAEKRNPYNEIECSDHYARAMMSHATYLAALGFEHHGPRGHLGFRPVVGPDDFRAAFTVGDGWGSFAQHRAHGDLRASVELRFGQLAGLRTFALGVDGPVRHVTVTLRSKGRNRPVSISTFAVEDDRLLITLGRAITLSAGDRLDVHAS